MLAIGVLLVLVGGAVLFSVREKQRQIVLREMAGPSDRSSPLSRAIAELVGTAGGIYLSLNLARDFLALSVPDRVAVWPWRFEVEPLAAVSLTLALIQPYVSSLLRAIKR